MKKISGILMAIGLVASSSFGAMLDKGTRELTLAGQLDRDSLAAECSFGQFVLDNLIVGLGLTGAYQDMGDSVDMQGYGGKVFSQYHFVIKAPVIPFVGLAGGVVYSKISGERTSKDDTGWYGEGQAGIKTFVADNVAIAVYGFYDIANEEVFTNKDEMEKTNFGLRIGMNTYF